MEGTQPLETKALEPESHEDKEEDSRQEYASDDLDELNFYKQKMKKIKQKR